MPDVTDEVRIECECHKCGSRFTVVREVTMCCKWGKVPCPLDVEEAKRMAKLVNSLRG